MKNIKINTELKITSLNIAPDDGALKNIATGDSVIYQITIWGWNVRFIPDDTYPYTAPRAYYQRPGETQFTRYDIENGLTAAMTMEAIAISLINELPVLIEE